MKVIVPGTTRKSTRHECAYCGCVFDFARKEATRYRVDAICGITYRHKIKCPHCGKWHYEV